MTTLNVIKKRVDRIAEREPESDTLLSDLAKLSETELNHVLQNLVIAEASTVWLDGGGLDNPLSFEEVKQKLWERDLAEFEKTCSVSSDDLAELEKIYLVT